jgi:hypothetical protein
MADFNFRFETARNPRSGKRERKTVSTSAVNLTATAYTIASTADANKYALPDKLPTAAVMRVLTDAIYFTLDGSTPSSTVGFEAAVGDMIYLDSFQKIKEFKAIRKTTDASLEVLYLYGA